jgi:glycosyltransferase involved in cell wall biosynthesis
VDGKALRILQIIGSLHPRHGGTVECLRQIGGALARGGHAVEVVACSDLADAGWLTDFPLRAHALGPGFGSYGYTPRLKPWLAANGARFDAWIVHGLWQYPGFGASRLAHRMGIPYLIYAHGMLDPWNRRATPLKYAKKLLYWLAAERWTLEHAAALVFTSDEERSLATRYFPSGRWREAIVGNGISEPPAPGSGAAQRFRAAQGIPLAKRILLYLGRIHPKKGIDLLMHAFSSLPAARESCVLVIAGPGDASYVESLKASSAELGIEDAIRWAGPLYGGDKWQAFSAADLFVLPSHQENFGIALVESLASGTPVCTTTGVNIHDQLERCNAGIICRDDEHGVAAALARWLALGEDEKTMLRSNARRCYEAHFRVDLASAKLIDAIGHAISRNRQDKGAAH